MPTTNHTATPTAPSSAPKRSAGRGRPGPFPVTIVRPATVPAVALTALQRHRRRAASHLAHRLTEAANMGIAPRVSMPVSVPLHMVAEAAAIVRDAPATAADPLPGALQIGRNLHGRPVAVVVHAETWSLVLRPHPHRSDKDTAARTATSWVFLDGDGKGYRRTFIGLCFDDEDSGPGAGWNAMVRRVLTITA